jgi:hypothetical protein
VEAKLMAVANVTGVVTTIATFTSNNFPSSPTSQMHSVTFSHTFNFYANAYYVQVRVRRTSTTSNPKLSLVRIRESIG